MEKKKNLSTQPEEPSGTTRNSFLKRISTSFKKWWRNNICAELPNTEDEEFSEKYRT